jgi:hypothetical protein
MYRRRNGYGPDPQKPAIILKITGFFIQKKYIFLTVLKKNTGYENSLSGIHPQQYS